VKRGAPSNPFSSHRVAPGAIAYLFEEGESADGMLARLDRAPAVLELVGIHGAGKSTLLHTLRGAAESRGAICVCFRARRDEPRLPWSWRWKLRGAAYCFIDGGEVIRPRQLAALIRACTARGIKAVLTAHVHLGHGEPFNVQPRAEALAKVATELTRSAAHNPAAMEVRLRDAGGSAREVLFRLYDEWEECHSHRVG